MFKVPQLDPKGKSKDPGLNQSLNTPTKPTSELIKIGYYPLLNCSPDETQIEEETTSSALAKGSCSSIYSSSYAIK